VVPSALSTSAPSVAAATPDPCAKDALVTITPGKLTIGTENPAFPPYYQPASPRPSGSPWELGDPRTGEGLEGATAYAVAQKLGFTRDDVVWVAMPLKTATEAGAKPFDYYLAQVSYSPDLSQGVDLSDGYFDVPHAVLALKDNAIGNASSIAALRAFKLGGPVGESYVSITDQIKPTREADSYDTLDAGLSALQAKKIDGLVVDLPTALHVRDVQLTDAVIVGSLPTVGLAEPLTIVISKPHAGVAGVAGNPLTACINRALAALKADGTLKEIADKWITSLGVPELS
jgi:polar amino acid transport system substrate-binding protein